MALMDDDIISSSLYTGEVILTSPLYDMTLYDTVKLAFDYNFHPFEDGGKGNNNSFFEVEVYDGAIWQSVVFDNDSSCPWHNVWQTNCTTSLSIDITAFANENLRVRFVYNDGSDGKWTGMIALDNFQVSGVIAPPSNPCEETVHVGSGMISGLMEASQIILIANPVEASGSTTLSSPATEIHSEFEIPMGIDLTVDNEGCTN